MVIDLMKEIINNSPVVVFLWEAKTGWKIQYVSDNVIQFGYKPEELITGTILYPDLIHPEDRERTIKEVQQFSVQQLDHYTQEYRIITKSGEIKWVDDRTIIRRNENNEIVFHQGVIIDITDRKKAEELKNEFINTITHELRTPLTSIRESINLLGMLNPDKENPEHKFILETSKRNINRLSKLINDILDFQKIEFGAMIYHFENHQINDLIHQVVDELMSSMNAKGLKVNLELSDQIPEIPFDWDRIEDVLFNLISNAIKYSDKGQISIGTTYAKSENAVALSVSDTGIGLTKEDIPKAFEKFQQLSKDYNRNKDGSGLGLTIVKKIIEAHKAKINVESDFGKGSTFTIYLPIHKN